MVETIPSLLFAAHDADPDAPAYSWRDGEIWRTVAHREALARISQVARTLVRLGAEPGVKVGIVSETRREWAAIDLATTTLGAVTVGIYPSMLAEQIAYQLHHAEARIVVVEDAVQAAKIASVRSQLPHLQTVLSLETVDGLDRLDSVLDEADVDWLRSRGAERVPEDVATLVYTSGTTGHPKGAVLTHGNFHRTAVASRVVVDTRPGETSVAFLPMAHSLQRFTLYAGLHERVHGYYSSIADLPEALLAARPANLVTVPRMLEKIRARVLAGVEARGGARAALFHWALGLGLQRVALQERGTTPPTWLALRLRLADRLVFRKIRERLGGNLRLVVSGGSRLDPQVARFYTALGVLVLEGWGLTETSAPATANRHDAWRIGTVGPPIPGVQVRIAADGEIEVHGPGNFTGYYKDDAATAEAFTDDGWFRTGDIGVIDRDGFLRITDRKKEILVTAGGKNIPPVNLEKRLERHPLVGQAVVIGNNRPYLVALLFADREALDARAQREGWPERGAALLDRDEVHSLFGEAVSEANVELARFEQVKRFEVLADELTADAGELTPTLKLKRRVIDARYAEVIGVLYARPS